MGRVYAKTAEYFEVNAHTRVYSDKREPSDFTPEEGYMSKR